MKERSDIYAGVAVRGPNRKTVLVYDSSKDKPAWKFAGGGRQFLPLLGRWETPEETARRELYEETGLLAKELTLLILIDKGTHIWYLFEAQFDSFEGLLSRGNDGEYVSVFPESQVLEMPNFLSHHKQIAKKLGIFSLK